MGEASVSSEAGTEVGDGKAGEGEVERCGYMRGFCPRLGRLGDPLC